MKILIRTILISIFFIQISNKEEQKIEFKVNEIRKTQISCSSNLGTYLFDIYGEFSTTPSVLNQLTINLETPSKYTANCYPLSKSSVSEDHFQCEINICEFPLKSTNIFLSLNPPSSEKYSFPNWKETIGSSPKISNKVPDDDIVCTPSENDTFTPNSITNDGCSGKKNHFKIVGGWKDETILPKNVSFVLRPKNKENVIVNCNFSKYIFHSINCNFEGDGKLSFDDSYFKDNLRVYKINKFNTNEFDKCEFSRFISVSFLLLLNFIFLL